MLDHPDLETRCFQSVGPYAGSHIIYDDPARVRGRFAAGPEPKLIELTLLAITRDGADQHVALT
jgi:hypothetical protein